VSGADLLTTTVATRLPVELLTTLRPLVAAHHDPTIRIRASGFVRAAHTPEGPGTVVAARQPDGGFLIHAHGPGARWLLDRVGGLLGVEDEVAGFDPTAHPAVARAHHRRPGLRMLRTGTVVDVLVPTIIAQRVTSVEAAGSWTRLVRRLGSAAPGPFGLLVPPDPATLSRVPAGVFHELGIERARARRIVEACRHVAELDAALELEAPARLARWLAIPGIGPWTAAHLARVAAGDPDAVEVGDHNTKHLVAWNLVGEPRGTDEQMLSLLAPFAGHRGRVVRLLGVGGQQPPRFGPRHRLHPVEDL
jgi:endonuclease III